MLLNKPTGSASFVRRLPFGAAIITALLAMPALATLPAGLDSRANLGAYLNGTMPNTYAPGTLPSLLSSTGAFSNLSSLTPNAGLVPYTVNSPFWSDGAAKQRWIGLPYDGTSNSPTIGFAPTGRWTFPNGTVFVKHFELVVNEQTGATRRLETRILVRDVDGGIYGTSYRWRVNLSDADIVPSAQEETIQIIGPDGVTTRNQTYFYPGQSDCLRCHNDVGTGEPQGTGLVLGIKTRQLNGNFTYTSTGRTDNQIHTWNHLGMLSAGVPDQTSYPQYDKLVQVGDTNATLEHRIRSYLDSNCSHCHRPNGEGPLFDARFDTPILNQNLIGDGTNGSMALVRYNISASRIHFRDASTSMPMPPLGRKVPHQEALTTYAAWVNYAFDVVAVQAQVYPNKLRVVFDRALDPATATDIANYALNNGVTILGATLDTDPRVVTLTTSAMAIGGSYRLIVNRVKEAQAPQNPIWPNTARNFTFEPVARTDFNDDGRADILLRNPNTGENYLYPMNGTAILAGEGYIRTVPAPWNIVGLGDFDGNGTTDILLRNSSTGENYIYFMNGTTIANEGYVRTVPLAWSVAGVADLDGDGKADILLRNPSTGANYLYPMDGLNIKGTEGYIRTVPAPWTIAGLADFNGDGRADILLRNTTTGENYLYPMNGTSILGTEGYIRTVPLAWDIAGLGDFDGDGKADILLRNSGNGDNYLYPMDGTSIKPTEGYIRTVPLVWAVANIADFDGDGKVDILLRNTSTGENYLYPMDGTNIKPTEGYIRTVPLAWTVVSK
jgi:hypothetical protein